MSDVTRILSAIDAGDPHAAAELLPLVYDELRRLAAQKLAQEKPGQTLDATALVHEAYLRLIHDERRGLSPPDSDGGDKPRRAPEFRGRGHFFGAAAEAMRRILIDGARRRRRRKHGGDRRRLPLDALALPADERGEDLLALDEALKRLAEKEPVKAELVKLRYFAGLSLDDAAACLEISSATAKRYWAVARAWLYAAIADEAGSR